MDLIQSVDPRLWGSSAWVYLDAVVKSYPILTEGADPNVAEEWVKRMYLFWTHLYLPCAICMKHYETFLQTHPVDKALCDGHEAYLAWYETLKSEISKNTTTTLGLDVHPMPIATRISGGTPPSTDHHHIPVVPVSHPPQASTTISYAYPSADAFVGSGSRKTVYPRMRTGHPVRSKINRPCPCSARYSMTSMIQAGSANMASKKRR